MTNTSFNDNRNYQEELLTLIRSGIPDAELKDRLSDYHEKDIAEALEALTDTERKRLYLLLSPEELSEIFSYLEDAEPYIQEMNDALAAAVISEMDADDAADILEDLEEEKQSQLVSLMDSESSEDVKLLLSYNEDEIGSRMTTNFILIQNDLSIRQAMKELINQAGENDNINTIYTEDENHVFYGAIELKDLITARENDSLEDLIIRSYPFVKDHEKTAECIESLKDYSEDSIPVLNEHGEVIGVITAQDITEAVDEEMGDDYAKLAGLSSEEDLNERTADSIKKRLPWLVILLFLGMGVSFVVGIFEVVIAALPIIMSFQSLILDMAGNVGTQSLAVTIRVLMDENLTGRQKLGLVVKEMRIGFCNGLLLGLMAFVFVGAYIFFLKGNPLHYALLISGCVGVSLLTAMVISSLVGTVVPMFFRKIHIDPAVASGPLITTINDLVAVVTYYGLSWLLLIHVLHLV